MSSASLFEQLTSSVSPSMLATVSVAILVLLLTYTVACRIFFSSSKSKTSSSKQVSNKDKKPKETTTTKKQQADVTTTNKKKNNKAKKNAVPISSASPSTQSEESDHEKAALVTPPKKSTTPTKASSTKQQAENVEGISGDNKNKQSKLTVTPASANVQAASNKQKPAGKRDATIKVNTNNAKKNEPAPVNVEPKRTLTAGTEVDNEPEEEGQWLTQGSKQVNNRNRNKGKIETPNTNNATLAPSNTVVEQRPIPAASNVNVVPPIITNEFNVDASIPSKTPATSNENQEPIEIYQLLPTNGDLYTSNDTWWKQALNKQQTFSIDDIGEWPEYEPDEQYTVQVKRIMPVKKPSSDGV